MILRRFIAAVALLCAVSPAYAQKTKAQLSTEVTATYPDNSVGAITPAGVRAYETDVLNSIMPTAPVVSGNTSCFDGTTGLLKDCGSVPLPPLPNNTTTFLRGDGMWVVPTGGGNVIGTGSSVSSDIPIISNTTTTGITDSGFNISQIPGLVPSTATVTISIASPAVVTWAGHGLQPNAPVYFCTSGALPTGLAACVPGTGSTMSPNSYGANPTLYYVIGSSITTNTFQVATSIANAKAGIAVNTTGTQSGTQTAFANSAACAGCIGEHIYTVVPPTGAGDVLCNNSSPDTVWASITLQPGIWQVWGAAGVFGSSGAVFSTNHSSYGVGITGICSTPYCGTTDWHLTTNNSNGVLFPYNASIIPIYSANTVVNAVSEPVWTGTTIATCFGDLHAVRIH